MCIVMYQTFLYLKNELESADDSGATEASPGHSVTPTGHGRTSSSEKGVLVCTNKQMKFI